MPVTRLYRPAGAVLSDVARSAHRARRRPGAHAREAGNLDPPEPDPPRADAPGEPATGGGPGEDLGGTGPSGPGVGAPAASMADAVVPRSPPTFEELGRRVARPGPRRGSMLQPPPAWEPDEVTLGFAMAPGEDGHLRELPEPIVLATILIAAESDRRRLINRLASGAEEQLDSVASLYWPLLILPGRHPPEVAVFDGTGVWKRTFRYTLLPPMDDVVAQLDRRASPAEHLAQFRALMPYFGHDPGAEVMTIEGFLPVDPPLLFDILSQAEFRSDPQSPHAGFLPARHELGWYRELVDRMHRWLERFEGDLTTLASIKERVLGLVQAAQAQLDGEVRTLEGEGRARASEAQAAADLEVERLHRGHRETIRRHLAEIREAQAVVAHAETHIQTSEALALRASHRRTDAEAHVARGRHAEGQIRAANRQIAEARRAIEAVHARERSDLERAVSRVAQVEHEHAQRLAERELFRDEFAGVGADLVQAIDGQLSARAAQKNLLAGYFLPLPSLAQIRVVWFPLWIATLRGPRGLRQLVFPPMRVRTDAGLGGTLKRIFGGVVLPLEPRTAQFDKVLRSTMEDSLANDPWLSTATQELTRAADVLTDPDVLLRFQSGLKELGRAGWITPKQEQEFLNALITRSQQRAAQAVPPPPPPPGYASPNATDTPPSP